MKLTFNFHAKIVFPSDFGDGWELPFCSLRETGTAESCSSVPFGISAAKFFGFPSRREQTPERSSLLNLARTVWSFLPLFTYSHS